MMSSKKVIVVGSGVAGLGAMRRLYEAGIEAVCLEGLNRIGGKINTIPFGDNYVELGAAVCEGDKDNIIYDMLEPLGVLTKRGPFHEEYILSTGKLINSQTASKFNQFVLETIKTADCGRVKTVAEALGTGPNIDCLSEDTKRGLLQWATKAYEIGGQKDPTLAKTLQEAKERLPSRLQEFGFKEKGMQLVLDILMKKYPNKSEALPLDIQINKEVTHIQWRNEDKLVKVLCEDGSTYEAGAVILTMSVGVLKERHSKLFTPPLPESKLKALNELQMFLLDVIYVEFDQAWWSKTPARYNLIWLEEDLGKFDSKDKWVTEIYRYDTVPHQERVLKFWINDEGARCMEMASEDEVEKGIEKLLKVVFKEERPVKDFVRTKWLRNRLERGAHALQCAGAEGTDLREALGQPVGEGPTPGLCFAGEATSPQHHGTVHGALETGFREADRVIEYFSRGN